MTLCMRQSPAACFNGLKHLLRMRLDLFDWHVPRRQTLNKIAAYQQSVGLCDAGLSEGACCLGAYTCTGEAIVRHGVSGKART